VLFKSTDGLLRRVLFRNNVWLADTLVAVLGHAQQNKLQAA
jgi:hypothetical protein